MPSNTAAWQPTPGVPLEVKSAEYSTPAADQIVIKNHALALNPIDFRLQDSKLFPFLQYPTILGTDVSGEVVEVGSAAAHRFKVGDRVIGQVIGSSTNTHTEGGFQLYATAFARLASPIPSSLPCRDAVVLPLGVSTAACGLFQTTHLALRHPSVSPAPTGQTLLVWGGSSSVGANAVQLAVAAGYEVYATASPRNFAFVKTLGAAEVFDYHQDRETLTERLVDAFEGKTIAGAYQAAGDVASAQVVLDVLARSSGRKFLASSVAFPETLPEGVEAKRVFGTTLKDNEVSVAVYEKFLPEALAQGKYLTAPGAEVVGNGLDAIQTGLDILRKGVSATKLVVTLD